MISGIILAAGSSKRMGTPKQPLKLAGRPMVQCVVDTFLASSLDEVVVVLNPALEWKPKSRKRLRLVENSRAYEGISTSVRAGLDSITSESGAAVIGLGDKPLLHNSTIQKMIEAYKHSSSEVIMPVYHGKRGNPILFRRSLFDDMRSLKGDVGAKSLISQMKHSVLELPVEDLGVILDVDTPAELRAASRLISARKALAGERKTRK
jgi:molybdenum cofactor cytidylyltransferase